MRTSSQVTTAWFTAFLGLAPVGCGGSESAHPDRGLGHVRTEEPDSGNPTAPGGAAGVVEDGGSAGQGTAGSGGSSGATGDATGADSGPKVITGGPGADLGCGPGSAYGLSKTDDPVRSFAEATAMAALEAWVGRFYNGTSPVYRGTLEAHDNQSVFPGFTDQTIPLGPALADIRPVTGGPEGDGLSLFVYSDVTDRYIELQQPTLDPQTTNVFMILSKGTTGGRFGGCTDCASPFANAPSTIDAKSASVVYSGEGASAPLAITVSTTLAIVSPCDLQYADLVRLNGWQRFDGSQTDAPIDDTGIEVLHSGGRYSPPGSSRCPLSTPYKIDLFIDRAHPWVFGIGNYEASVPSVFCPV